MNWASKNKALLVMLLAATLLTARWIWIVRDNSDFGLTFESASRISHGEAYGRDFFINVPPLIYYTEAFFIRLLGGNLWSDQIHLFGWWYLSLITGYLLARKFTEDENVLTAGGLMAVVISSPAANCGQSYNYAATTLTGLAICLCIAHQKNRSGWLALILGGALAGLSIFAKQNVGLALVMVLFFFVVLDSAVLARVGIRATAGAAVRLIFGIALGFGIPLVALGRSSSVGNIYQLIFRDGASEKGGLLHFLPRVIPRLGLIDIKDSPHYRMIQIGVSAAIMAVVLAFSIHRLRRLGANPATTPEAVPAKDRHTKFTFYLVLLAITFLSAVSLLQIPAIRSIGDQLAALCLVKKLGFGLFTGQLVFLVVIVTFTLIGLILLNDLIKTFRLEQAAAPAFGVEFFSFFTVSALATVTLTANIMYFPFAAPVVIPMVVFELNKRFRISLCRMNLVTIASMALFYMSPGYATTFQSYKKLPADSPFAGLYGSPLREAEVRRIWTHVHPLINGKTTLWMVESGLQTPFGGLTVPNATCIDTETHTAKTQEILVKLWDRNLPERVIREPGWVCNASNLPKNSFYFADPWFSKWLGTNYVKIDEQAGLEVWAKIDSARSQK